jgi:hypothetical protein
LIFALALLGIRLAFYVSCMSIIFADVSRCRTLTGGQFEAAAHFFRSFPRRLISQRAARTAPVTATRSVGTALASAITATAFSGPFRSVIAATFAAVLLFCSSLAIKADFGMSARLLGSLAINADSRSVGRSQLSLQPLAALPTASATIAGLLLQDDGFRLVSADFEQLSGLPSLI